MGSRHLTVDQVDVTFDQKVAKMSQRNLGCIALQAEHGLAEKNAAERNAIKPAHEALTAPYLHTVRESELVQPDVCGLHFR